MIGMPSESEPSRARPRLQEYQARPIVIGAHHTPPSPKIQIGTRCRHLRQVSSHSSGNAFQDVKLPNKYTKKLANTRIACEHGTGGSPASWGDCDGCDMESCIMDARWRESWRWLGVVGRGLEFIKWPAMFRSRFPDPRSLVPLQTLQHTLSRSLYPHHHLQLLSMTQTLSPPAHSPPDDQENVIDGVDTKEDPDQPQQSLQEPQDDNTAHRCQWLDCDQALPDPESLYNHLCNDHIGRKSTGNLCLTCKWKDCGTTCAKRDHITSHLRGKHHIH